jgi:2-polyprenyl-3-methyl-5-hydroxy-6-metoxy-1,4-benzoquinol methylase
MDCIAGDSRATMTPESAMYIYATEKVGEYYKLLELEGKRILSVIGSGDQILNAAHYGANHVTGFDVNKRAILFVDLKTAALKNLSYDEFLTFFGKTFEDASFDHSLYSTFRAELKEDTRSFFDNLYQHMSGSNFSRSDYFRQRAWIDVSPLEINSYLQNEESFEKAKVQQLKTYFKYIAAGIDELVFAAQGDLFDVVNLSNIPNYFVGGKGDRIEEFLSILRNLATMLTPTGAIFFYSYSPLMYINGEPYASTQEAKQKIQELGLYDIEMKYLSSMINKGQDRITILKKK